jgi:triosephosphate isomerase (TIM)
LRVPFICGNWKLQKTVAEAVAFVSELRNQLGTVRDVEIAVAPVFTAIHAVAKRLEGSHIKVAAQDCFWEDKGAWTGEVSAPMLKEAGCAYVIIGHSERRQHFGELDAAVNLKARAVLRAGINPIICIGETLAERDAGEALGRIGQQLDAALSNLTPEDASRIVLAYEPVWAIGTGRNATPDQAQEVHGFIRGRLREKFAGVADEVRIQYGGSVKPDNIATLMAQPDVDGALVGGASLTAEQFVPLVRYKKS